MNRTFNFLFFLAKKYALLFLILTFIKNNTQADLPSFSFEKIRADSQEKYQDIIDESLFKISQTTTGQKIIRQILNCQKEAIEIHLGVSEQMAKSIGDKCSLTHKETASQNSLILESPLDVLSKTIDRSREEASVKRTYTFLLTHNSEWSFDSWTNPSTNNTSIVLPIDEQGHIVEDESRILEILAHETAIYFDSKFWSGSTQFETLPGVESFYNDFTISKERVALALDNPIIAHSLAFLRAFQAEQNMTNELNKKNIIYFSAQDLLRRQQRIQSFGMCKGLCLHNFLKRQIEYQSNMALPLYAYAPSYRARLWTFLQENKEILPGNSFDTSESYLKELLLETPSRFYLDNTHNNIHILLEYFEYNFFTADSSFANLKDFNTFVELNIHPIHLEDLEKQKYPLSQQSALEYMATPLLSGFNVRMSSGPRPRIIVGGF